MAVQEGACDRRGQRLGARDRPRPNRHLENRQRVHRRAGGVVEPQGGDDKHELPATQPAAHVHEGVAIGGVEEPQPHRDDPDFVNGQPESGITAGIDVVGGIGHKDGDAPLMEPRQGGRV